MAFKGDAKGSCVDSGNAREQYREREGKWFKGLCTFAERK